MSALKYSPFCCHHSKRFTTMLPFGATTKLLTLTEVRLGSTQMRPNFPPTGTHPSLRSASVWWLTARRNLLQSAGTPAPCILWSLMDNTATLHWVVTRGSRWLVLRPPCNTTVIRRGLTPLAKRLVLPKQESASLETMRGTVEDVTPESGLVLEEILMTLTLVETKLCTGVIMVTSTSRPWVTS